MANRMVHAIFVVVGFRSQFMDLLKMLIYNSQEYLEQTKPTNDSTPLSKKLKDYLLRDYVATTVTQEVVENIKKDFITDLESIRKIKGIMWSATKKQDLTHGVIFFYLSSKSKLDLQKCISDCDEVISKIKSMRGDSQNKPLLSAISDFFGNKITDEDSIFLNHFSIKDLEDIRTKLESSLSLYNKLSGSLIGAAKIYDGVEEFQDNDYKNNAWVRLDPDLKKIQFFGNPIPHSELIGINASDDDNEFKPFGVFSGRPISLSDSVANQLLAKIKLTNSLNPWLEGTVFGETAFEKHKITPNNWHVVHRDNDIFNAVEIASGEPIIEQQVRSYFLNYAVDAISDSQKHTDRFIEVRTPKKINDLSPVKEYRADYFVRVSNVLVPVEAKADIGDGEDVLSQIQQYANIDSFYVRNYDTQKNKFIRMNMKIEKPHGVVLIGDRNGLYLAYSDKNLEGRFVYRNGYQLFWSCSEIQANIKDIRQCVKDLYNLHDKFYSGQIANYDKYELRYDRGQNQYKRIQEYLKNNPIKQKGWFGF